MKKATIKKQIDSHRKPYKSNKEYIDYMTLTTNESIPEKISRADMILINRIMSFGEIGESVIIDCENIENIHKYMQKIGYGKGKEFKLSSTNEQKTQIWRSK